MSVILDEDRSFDARTRAPSRSFMAIRSVWPIWP